MRRKTILVLSLGRRVAILALGITVTFVGMGLGIGSKGKAGSFSSVALAQGQCGIRQWVQRYDNPIILNGPVIHGNEGAKSMVVDPVGNVYVTGWSEGGAGEAAYVIATVKYDSYGNQKWVRRYGVTWVGEDGTVTGYDNEGYGIALDRGGNVYVSGFSYGKDTGYDYCVIKYDTHGNQQWVRNWDSGLGGQEDVVQANIAVDPAGNAYVTGSSNGEWSNCDITTIKYDTNGNQKWVATYSGGAGFAVAVDKNGDVYVAGFNGDIGALCDFVTIKYDGQTGLPVWMPNQGVVDDQGAARYHNGDINSAFGIALGPDGSVYVAGGSNGSGTGFDWVTIKYRSTDTDADVLLRSLVQKIEGFRLKQGIAKSLETKLNNALAAVTAANASWRYDVINKLNAFINECQGQRGKELTVQQADSLVADAKDIVSILPSSLVGKSVVEEWVARYDGPAHGDDVATPSYGPSWMRAPYVYNKGIAVDSAGDVVVTGWSTGVGTGIDFATIKYDGQTGQPMWNLPSQPGVPADQTSIAARYDGPAHGDDLGWAIGLDADGNIFVTGQSYGIGTDADSVTIAYKPDGSLLWTNWPDGAARYDAAHSSEHTLGVGTDPSGNVYVIGGGLGIDTGWDFITMKYGGCQ